MSVYQRVLGQNSLGLRPHSMAWDTVRVRAIDRSRNEDQEEADQRRDIVPYTSWAFRGVKRLSLVFVAFLAHSCHRDDIYVQQMKCVAEAEEQQSPHFALAPFALSTSMAYQSLSAIANADPNSASQRGNSGSQKSRESTLSCL